jgi:acyl-CoA thioesterase-1
VKSAFIIRLVAVVVFAAACSAAASAQSQTVLIVGDSLSSGLGVDADKSWVALLQNRLEAEGYGYRVVNASISGDTTGGGLRRLPRALEQHDPDIVVLELGGNDGLRGTPVDIIHRNLAQMIELARDGGAAVILAGMQMPPNYGSAYTEAFARLYPDLASHFGVGLVSFFLEGVALDPTFMQADGIHPNEAGQPILLQNVWRVLEPKLQS